MMILSNISISISSSLSPCIYIVYTAENSCSEQNVKKPTPLHRHPLTEQPAVDSVIHDFEPEFRPHFLKKKNKVKSKYTKKNI